MSSCSCIHQQAAVLYSLHQHFWAARATSNPYCPCQPNGNDARAQPIKAPSYHLYPLHLSCNCPNSYITNNMKCSNQ